MGGGDRKRKTAEGDAVDASVALTGRRDRGPADVAEIREESPVYQGARCRVGYLHVTFAADKEGVEGHAQRRNPDLKARWADTHASAVEIADAAFSAWTAVECNRVLGQKSAGAGETSRWVW